LRTAPGARAEARQRNVTVNEERFFKNRKYRDSAYALLASMYAQTEDDATELSITDIKRVASRFTDHTMDYDYRTHKQGGWYDAIELSYILLLLFAAWSAIKDLEKRGYVIGQKNFRDYHYYKLTQAGREVCFALFNDKFHPTINDEYVLVKPKCAINRQGHIEGRQANNNGGRRQEEIDHQANPPVHGANNNFAAQHRAQLRGLFGLNDVGEQNGGRKGPALAGRNDLGPAPGFEEMDDDDLDDWPTLDFTDHYAGRMTIRSADILGSSARDVHGAVRAARVQQYMPSVKTEPPSSSSSSGVLSADAEFEQLVQTMVTESAGAIDEETARRIVLESCSSVHAKSVTENPSQPSESQQEEEFQTTLAISASLADTKPATEEFHFTVASTRKRPWSEVVDIEGKETQLAMTPAEKEEDEFQRALNLSASMVKGRRLSADLTDSQQDEEYQQALALSASLNENYSAQRNVGCESSDTRYLATDEGFYGGAQDEDSRSSASTVIDYSYEDYLAWKTEQQRLHNQQKTRISSSASSSSSMPSFTSGPEIMPSSNKFHDKFSSLINDLDDDDEEFMFLGSTSAAVSPIRSPFRALDNSSYSTLKIDDVDVTVISDGSNDEIAVKVGVESDGSPDDEDADIKRAKLLSLQESITPSPSLLPGPSSRFDLRIARDR
jgi:DNA-binding MarR family transcriptional regulator